MSSFISFDSIYFIGYFSVSAGCMISPRLYWHRENMQTTAANAIGLCAKSERPLQKASRPPASRLGFTANAIQPGTTISVCRFNVASRLVDVGGYDLLIPKPVLGDDNASWSSVERTGLPVHYTSMHLMLSALALSEAVTSRSRTPSRRRHLRLNPNHFMVTWVYVNTIL